MATTKALTLGKLLEASANPRVPNALTDTVASWAITSTFAGVADPREIYFKPDGTKMFLLVNSTINQYTLSTPWDITTAGSLVSITNTWDTASLGMFFSPDGTKLVTCGQTAVVNAGLSIAASEDRAYYLTLSSAWDISSTITLVSSLRFGSGDAGLPAAETAPAGITFNSDGTIMYMIGSTVDAIYQYTLSTAYNVGTATYSKQLSIASVEGGGSSIEFNTAGTRMYITGTTDDAIVEYRLTTAWDIATAVYYDELYVAYSEATPQGVYIDEATNSAYMVGTGSDLVTKFSTNSNGVLITPTLTNGNGKIDLVGDTRIKTGNLYVNKSLLLDGSITLAGSIIASGNLVANQISTTTTAITLGSAVSTGATAITTSQTSGAITIGGVSGTGNITVGQATTAQTLNLGTGATAISTTKAVNIGTSGVSGSISNIIIGSATAGTDTTLNASGRVAIVQPTGGIGTVSNTASGTTVTGVGTLFTRTFQVGDSITIGAQTVAISAIASDTSMTTAAITNANTTVAYSLTGGTRFVVNSNGNVGIGTATPGNKLEISGGSIRTINNTSGRITFNNGTTEAYVGFNGAGTTFLDAGALPLTLNAQGANYITVNTNSAERMRITSAGDLGVGTSSPSAQIHAYSGDIMVGSGASVTSRMFRALEVGTAGNNAGISFGNNGAKGAIYGQSGTGGMYIVGSTNGGGSPLNFGYSASDTGLSANYSSLGAWNTTGLGIGVTSPAGKLDVAGDVISQSYVNGTASYYFQAKKARGTISVPTVVVSGDTLGGMIGGGYDGTAYQYSGAVQFRVDGAVSAGVVPMALQFMTGATSNYTERMRIDSTGNVGIGATPSSRLTVSGTNTNDNAAYWLAQLYNSAAPVANVGTGLAFATNVGTFGATICTIEGIKENATSDNYASALKFTTRANGGLMTEKMRIDSSGNVGIGTTNPGYKLQIGTVATTTAAVVSALTPVIYIDGGTTANSSIVVKTHTQGAGTVHGAIRLAVSPDAANYSWSGMAGIADVNGAASTLAFYTANGNTQGTAAGASTERMRIDINGNLGIGTSSPLTRLDTRIADAFSTVVSDTSLNNNTSTVARFSFLTDPTPEITAGTGAAISISATPNRGETFLVSTHAGTSKDASDFAVWTTNGGVASEKMRVTNAGNVGIGSTSPSSITGGKCLMLSNAGFATISVQAVDGTNDRNATLELLSSGNGSSYSQILYGDTDTTPLTPSPLVFASYHSGVRTERMRIQPTTGYVGIGDTSPANKFDVYQADTGIGAARLRHANGNAVNVQPSYNYYDAYNHIFRGLNGTTESIRINDSGNIVLGYNLATVCSVTKTFATAHEVGNRGADVRFGIADGSFGGLIIPNVASSNPSFNAQYIEFHTHQGAVSAGERMRITADGNVGIGTTAPGRKLEVYSAGASYLKINSATTSQSALEVTNGSGNFYVGIDTSTGGAYAAGAYGRVLYSEGAYPMVFYTGSSERMRIDSSGRVLINRTSTDGGQLNVTGNTSTTTRAYPNATIRNARTLGTHYGLISWDGKFVADAWIGQVPGGDTLCFGHDAGTTIVEHMRIYTSGEVGIGSTTVSSAKLNVIHAGTYGVYIGGAAGASTSVIFFSGATNTGSISTNGTNTAFNTTSDYRLKENITPLTGALAKVALLKPVTYKWKSDGSDGEGFIAHELAEVCPQAVHGEKDGVETIDIKDAYDNVTGTETRPAYQGIDTSFLVATLTKAIQEQQVMIEELKTRLAAAGIA